MAALLATIGLTAAAQAGFAFTFNGTAFGGSAGLSAYMTGVYGSSVVVSDAIATNNSFAPNPNETWIGNGTDYARVGPAGVGRDMEIWFQNVPLLSAQLRGFVFDEARGPVDFQIFAYDSTFNTAGGTVENPNASALVFHQQWNVAGNGTEIPIGPILFSRPVSLLVFSDQGHFDVGIDDLIVTVPAPAAALLGLVGVGLVNRIKRRV
ncbi:MAG: hypothetical protein U1D55_10335 [Phycisphaerae bacterium]